MIRNEYVHELPDFDTEELIAKAMLKVPDGWDKMEHDKIVYFYGPELELFKSANKWLADRFNIYQLKNGSWPIHVDFARACSLNVPVKNCNETKITRFYRPKNNLEFGTVIDSFSNHKPLTELKSNEFIGFVTSDMELVYEHVLTVPTLIRNDIPHDVINLNEDVRVILSCSSRLSWEETRNYLC